MSDVFSITLPIFLIIALGYLSIQIRLFDKSEIRTIGDMLDAHYLLACGLGSLLVMLAGLAVMHWGQKKPIETSGIGSRLVRSPLILAIVFGMTLSLLGIRLPTPLTRTVDMLAMASGPVALFVIGATLHGLRLEGMVNNLSLIVQGKLVAHPLAVLGATLIFPIQNPELRTAAILMAAVPMLSIYPLLGLRFDQEKLCSAALLGATVTSFATLSIVLMLLKL